MDKIIIEDRFISIWEAAQYLGLSRQTIYIKVRQGAIKAYRPTGNEIKRAYKFKKEDLDEYMGIPKTKKRIK